MRGDSVFSRRVLLAGMAVAIGGVAGCSDGRRRDATTSTGSVSSVTAGATATTTDTAPASTATSAPSGGYFPVGDDWETTTAAEAGFTEAGLAAVVEYVGSANSQSLVILHEGRIVSEQYWKGATADTARDLASCQKSVTSTLVGLARDRGLLGLDDPVSQYLPAGWTMATAAEEEAITIRHLLTMCSGLNERTLRATAAPGTVWEYNTEAYQKLRRVLEAAAGTDINSLSSEWLFDRIGIDGRAAWAERPGGDFTADAVGDRMWGLNLTARQMARFGLFAMRNGAWDGEQVTDPGWFAEAWSSMPLKRDYGYLWWLIGKGHLANRGAPADMVAALGAKDQKIYVVPSAGLVLARQGDAAREVTEAGSDFDAELLTLLLRARS